MGKQSSLRLLPCPICGNLLVPTQEKQVSAKAYEDCRRRCDSCGVGLSNSSEPTTIYRNPEHNVPIEVRAGCREVLSLALNERNRKPKSAKFGFSTSEDALTWTVFTHLAHTSQLGRVFSSFDILDPAPRTETLLLWGVPVPATSIAGQQIHNQLVAVCNELDEDTKSRSEPDVIVDCGRSGVIVVEVKYRSANSTEERVEKFAKYVKRTDLFANTESVRDSGLYELVRNWRVGSELALDRPFTLVNLVMRKDQRRAMKSFRSGIETSQVRQFTEITWRDFVSKFVLPVWLKSYLEQKGII